MDHVSATAAAARPGRPVDSESVDGSDDVFKALADPSRRLLLDSLFVDDGQTLGQLSARLPGMTRFGVMKHLRSLAAAGLVTARKIGREKLHYLNPLPIHFIYDRWSSKYAEPWVGALADLKMSLEAPVDKGPRLVFQVYIRSRPDGLWRAITDPDVRRGYLHSTRVEVLDADPPRKLSATWSFDDPPELNADPPSRVTWEIEPMGIETCRLTVRHDDLSSESATFLWARSGWSLALSSLKSLLETGAPLSIDR